MHCRQCGAENDDNAVTCVACGDLLQQGQGTAPMPPPLERVPTRLAPAILVTLFCCLPFGIVAIVYAARVNSKMETGDYAAARDASRKAAIWCWVSFGTGLFFTAILALMSAIAVPQFLAYKDRALNYTASAYLMTAASAQEAYHLDHNTYADSLEALRERPYGLSANEDIVLEILSADREGYEMAAYHRQGTKRYVLKGPEGTVREMPKQ